MAAHIFLHHGVYFVQFRSGKMWILNTAQTMLRLRHHFHHESRCTSMTQKISVNLLHFESFCTVLNHERVWFGCWFQSIITFKNHNAIANQILPATKKQLNHSLLQSFSFDANKNNCKRWFNYLTKTWTTINSSN